MDMVKNVSDYVKELSPNAIIRGGDFPGEKHYIDVALMFSQFSFIPKIKDFYEQATVYAEEYKVQLKETRERIEELSLVGKDLPSLLGK